MPAVCYTDTMSILRGLLCLLVLLAATPVLAAPDYFLKPTEQYEVLPFSGDPELKGEYYGELTGYPNLYEVVTGSPFSLTLTLVQPATPNPIPFSITVIEVLEEGQVREVASLRTSAMEQPWTERRDHTLGMTFLATTPLERDLPPGRYQVEVSTPDNIGRYGLWVGHRANPAGYFATWKRVVGVNVFFEHYLLFWFTSVFITPHLLALGFWYWWWRRRRRVPVRYA